MTLLQQLQIANDSVMIQKTSSAILKKAEYITENPSGVPSNSIEQAKRALTSPMSQATRFMGAISGNASIQTKYSSNGSETSGMDSDIEYVVGATWDALADML
jgi:hypothetical protein